MKRPFVIGLTGSVGMGKTTTARMFAEEGAAVWDADAAVARLYAAGGAGAQAIAELRPEAVVGGAVDRAALKRWIAEDPAALARIEAAIHPLVARDRAAFLRACRADVAVVDVPLLFETGAEREVDMTVVVSAPEAVQRARVLARPGMTEAFLDRLLAEQMPDAEKRRRADVVIETETMPAARAAVRQVMNRIRERRDGRT